MPMIDSKMWARAVCRFWAMMYWHVNDYRFFHSAKCHLASVFARILLTISGAVAPRY